MYHCDSFTPPIDDFSNMPTQPKIKITDYYDLNPSLAHTAGDIWSGLPSHGFVDTSTVRALVITPSCDLSNRKVETATYLPIVSVKEYLGLPAFLYETYTETSAQLAQGGLHDILHLPNRFIPPSPRDIESLLLIVAEQLGNSCVSAKEKLALARAKDGLELLKHQHKSKLEPVSIEKVKSLFGDKKLQAVLSKIIKNSQSLDIHFLPYDEQDLEYSGIPEHSVVLFRYSFSIPLEILDQAQEIEEYGWRKAMRKIRPRMSGAMRVSSARPMKHSSLKPRFLSDLLTRYVSMYVRLGSPDFTTETVAEFSTAICGEAQ
jgi:hypothetical protein